MIMTEENEEDFQNNNLCRFCEKEKISDKVRDHGHLTGKYKGPAHSNGNINVTQKVSKIILFLFHNFSNYDCHMFFKKLVNEKNDKVKFDNIPKTNEEYISVTYGCIRFIDSYRFRSSGLDSLVKILVDNYHKTLKILKEEIVDNGEILDFFNRIEEEDRTIKGLKEDYPDKIEKLKEALLNYLSGNRPKNLKTVFPDNWKNLTENLAYPYQYFNSLDDYPKTPNNFRKEDFLSKLKNKCPTDEEIEKAMDIIKC